MKIFRNYVGTMHILFGTMQEQCNSVCGTMLIRQLAALHLSRIKSGTKSIRSLRSQWLGQGRSLYKGDCAPHPVPSRYGCVGGRHGFLGGPRI